MERGNAKHNPRMDDALAEDVEGMVRGTGPTHAEEWKDPEGPADDDPELAAGHPVGGRFTDAGDGGVADGSPALGVDTVGADPDSVGALTSPVGTDLGEGAAGPPEDDEVVYSSGPDLANGGASSSAGDPDGAVGAAGDPATDPEAALGPDRG